MEFVHLREFVTLLQQTSKVQDPGNTLRLTHGEVGLGLVCKTDRCLYKTVPENTSERTFWLSLEQHIKKKKRANDSSLWLEGHPESVPTVLFS